MKYFLIAFLIFLMPASALANSSVYFANEKGVIESRSLPEKTVALTFDDGPTKYTEEILAILNDYQVKATFFVVGAEASELPILQKIIDTGHELGNHTYTHADLKDMPFWRMKLELNLSFLVMGNQTGRTSRLFRPPYVGSDNLLLNEKSKKVIAQASQLGYLTIGEDISTDDWRDVSAEEIIQAAINNKGESAIILFHDGGGDRSQTVEALPSIIEYYRQAGYQFMPVGQALGFSPEQVMPELTLLHLAIANFAGWLLGVWRWLGIILYYVVIGTIAAIFGRILLVLIAAAIQSRQKFKQDLSNDPCSVIVPAYNEAATIAHSIASLLKNDHKHFEVIVVDDGSSDETLAIAKSINDKRLKVVTKQNGGKASALNYGIGLAKFPIVVAVDADTVFKPDTLQKLCRHFIDAKVGAVSGNTKIVNRHNLLTQLQSLEYIVGFNLDRRMCALFDCITVVPGAIGAFRKKVVQGVGGFQSDTLAEDTDLTLAIKESGATIIYDEEAIAFTEAPSNVRDLINQRYRWTFGTMQAAWKHRRSFLNPRQGALGLIGMPQMIFYQIIFPLVGPLFDVGIVFGLMSQRYELIVTSFIFYTILDVFVAGFALKLDGERLSQLWLILPQRLLYRQLMYYVILKSAVSVLRGRLVGWGSLKREGTALAQT